MTNDGDKVSLQGEVENLRKLFSNSCRESDDKMDALFRVTEAIGLKNVRANEDIATAVRRRIEALESRLKFDGELLDRLGFPPTPSGPMSPEMQEAYGSACHEWEIFLSEIPLQVDRGRVKEMLKRYAPERSEESRDLFVDALLNDELPPEEVL